MNVKLTAKGWISLGTALLVLIIVLLARKELVQAWGLLEGVNIWVLLLLVPILMFDYYASGETFFSYLRAKGRLGVVPHLLQARLSLEMNFVNHVLPSGGVSGMSYITWRLGKLGVSSSRALMSQVVKVVMGIVAFLILLMVAVVIVTIDGSISRAIILFSSSIASAMIAAIVICLYIIASPSRVRKTSVYVTRYVNRFVAWVSLGRKKKLLDAEKAKTFMLDMHDDYLELKGDATVLKGPLVWSLIFTAVDILIFFVVFLALGAVVNPALLLIAYGVAMVAGFFVITPGGAGAYEALMIGFLTISGISNDVAIAGVVLARVIILVAILGIGWGFYQNALGGKKSA